MGRRESQEGEWEECEVATSCRVGEGGGGEANAGIPASGMDSKGGTAPEMGTQRAGRTVKEDVESSDPKGWSGRDTR